MKLFENKIVYLMSLRMRFWGRWLVSFLKKRNSSPEFMIIGAQKSGTTSLYKYIESFSKNFLPPAYKELQYFSENYNCSKRYYESYFPSCPAGYITGEASPTYLFYHKAPKRIKKFYKNIKLVVLVRNPIDRAYSHYNFLNLTDRTSGVDPLSFDEAVRREEERVFVKEDSDFFFEYKKFSYKKRGLYAEQLERWFECYDPSNFFFIETDELEKKPEKVVESLFEFLGLERNELPIHNQKHNENSYGPMSKESRDYLKKYFLVPNKKLFNLIGKSYDWS